MTRLQVNLLRVTVIVVFGLFAVISLQAQCIPTATDPCVSVHQSILDRTAKAIDELKAAQATIDAFLNERKATDAERQAWNNYKTITEAAIAIQQKGIADREALIALWQKAFESAMALSDHYLKELTKPKSGWQKFAATLEKVMLIATGVAIGRL